MDGARAKRGCEMRNVGERRNEVRRSDSGEVVRKVGRRSGVGGAQRESQRRGKSRHKRTVVWRAKRPIDLVRVWTRDVRDGCTWVPNSKFACLYYVVAQFESGDTSCPTAYINICRVRARPDRRCPAAGGGPAATDGARRGRRAGRDTDKQWGARRSI